MRFFTIFWIKIFVLSCIINQSIVCPVILSIQKKCIFPFKRHWAFKLCKRYGIDAGLFNIGSSGTGYLTPHIFRHSFAIHYLKNANGNQALVLLQDLLKHTKIDTTKVYLQFDQKELKKSLDQVFK